MKRGQSAAENDAAPTGGVGAVEGMSAMKLETRAVHAGTVIDPATGAVVSPSQLSVTFERDPDGGYSRGFLYGRNGNPNREALERCIADLEGGEDAAAFASGTAAIM